MQTPTVNSALLRPIDLADLGLWLREHDFAVSSTQLLTAARLLNGSRYLGEPAMLAAWLAPVFCSDLNQQNRFKAVYEDWLAQRPMLAPASSTAPVLAPLPDAQPVARRSAWRLAWKKSRLLILLILLVAANLILWSNQRDLPRYLAQVQETVAPAPVLAPRPKLPVLTDSVVVSVPAEPVVTYKINPIVAALLAALLLVSSAWWRYARLKQRAFLQRLPTDTAQERRRLRSANERPHAHLLNHARQLGSNLGRPVTLPTPGLNVAATLAATLGAGGCPCPVFGSRGEPGYLVLIDSAGRSDHQAQLAGLVLDAMQNQGLAQDCYEFDADPRRSRHAPRRGPVLHHGLQSLSALASRHAGVRLLIFSDGRGFIDPYTEDAAAWLAAFAAWEKPVMITPQARLQWGVREWRLQQSGLVLLPMDGEGMQLLGQLFDGERAVPKMDQDSCRRLRPLYLRNVDLWLDQIAPSKVRQAQLLQALTQDFNSDGMAWLCACAVYPALYWRITVMLGERLITDRERYAVCLAQIVRLPWMRAGFMPNWLREALLAELPPPLETQVREMLAKFLTLVFDDVQAAARDALQVAIAPGQRVGGVAQARKDTVFLRFMSGKPTQLVVDAGERLRQLLYLQGAPLAGPRRLPLVAAGLFGVVLAASALWVRVVIVPDNQPVVVQTSMPGSQECDFCPEMVQIPGGSFMMGSDTDFDDEKPAHPVKVAAFMMSKYELTQGQWKAVMGNNPSLFKECGDNCPVENVSWNDVQAYVAKINAKTGGKYRLPSEAEWEYAARAGSTGRWSFGDDETQLGKHAWFGAYVAGGNSGEKTHPVGLKLANKFGLHDMYGNVWEWVEDCWHDNYNGAPVDGSAWTKGCENRVARVLRGGGWFSGALFARSAFRFHDLPGRQFGYTGFRLAFRSSGPAGQ